MEIVRSSKGIVLYQRKHVLDILSETCMVAAKPCSTSMDYNTKLHSTSRSPLPGPAPYRRLLGKLLYLTNSGPYISYVVSHLCQFNSSPTDQHQQATNRILKYLKSSPALGLFFPSQNTTILKGFSNSYWAACLGTIKSVAGWCFFLGSSLIFWKSKK
ncbi:PREDICTED: uncharacterized protein LOC109329276 [Lupinus angustifolius]|uniref:uncharacterized protein LOC109329276 n=1 Tax=Lupinus angustifolius TaxID=3871 RepID=UPI00092E774B|nr:PREDICTED: uncharacterized protein LOC109329276 [Lupinus angustifolius]